MATHYEEVREIYHQVPVPVLLGPCNTGKSLVARVAASLMGGLHETAFYRSMTVALMVELLGVTPFFIYNDPEQIDVLKTMITKVRFILTHKNFLMALYNVRQYICKCEDTGQDIVLRNTTNVFMDDGIEILSLYLAFWS